MSLFSSKYSIELWTSTGQLIADLAGLAHNRSVMMSRNEAEEISFTLNMDELEAYCRSINLAPTSLLIPGSTEVRIKRLQKYLCGGQLVYLNPHLSSSDQALDVKATGFLNLFNDRYTGSSTAGSVGESFTATQATTIATTLISQSQALTNGSFGVTIGAQATVGVHDRSYSRTNIKTALQDLTKVQTNPFDFEFTYDKVFKTYAAIGSVRNDIIFEYPNNNILDVQAPIDATSIHNEVTALGQGGGDYAQAQAFASDLASQASYKLRQYVLISNGTDNSDNGITDAANSDLAAYSMPFQIPALVIDGNKAPYVTDYGIGDRISVKVGGYALLANLNGTYRIEKINLDIDDDDNEKVTLQVSA